MNKRKLTVTLSPKTRYQIDALKNILDVSCSQIIEELIAEKAHEYDIEIPLELEDK